MVVNGPAPLALAIVWWAGIIFLFVYPTCMALELNRRAVYKVTAISLIFFAASTYGYTTYRKKQVRDAVKRLFDVDMELDSIDAYYSVLEFKNKSENAIDVEFLEAKSVEAVFQEGTQQPIIFDKANFRFDFKSPNKIDSDGYGDSEEFIKNLFDQMWSNSPNFHRPPLACIDLTVNVGFHLEDQPNAKQDKVFRLVMKKEAGHYKRLMRTPGSTNNACQFDIPEMPDFK